jgi:DNA-binding PadR family transcriptional regulator
MRKRRDSSGLAPAVAAALPVRPSAFAVLAALAQGACPGFEILERANASLPARPILGPGTLYRLLRELRQEGLVRRASPPAGAAGAADERRSYHELTALGRSVLTAEAARLRRTLDLSGLRGST